MLPLLNENFPDQNFPPVETALSDPDGLLAVGGCLSPNRLLNAYRHGIFPWFNPGEPILWWSPDPRMILYPEHVHVSRSLNKLIKKNSLTFTWDKAFNEVIHACAQVRESEQGTWISDQMIIAYNVLHRLGHAHSAEVWQQDRLVGGLYGVAIGQVFFGESMFHRENNASKVAFVRLMDKLLAWGYRLVDCQMQTGHLMSLGAENISRQQFHSLLQQYCPADVSEKAWSPM